MGQLAGSVPRGPLLGAGALVVATLSLALLGRVGDVGRTAPPPGTPVAAYDVRFLDRSDGSVVVEDERGRTVDTFAPGTNGFARGVLRSLARDRHRSGIGQEPPFRLTRWTDGRLSLEDPSTGRSVSLEVFGSTNAEAFARLWRAADAAHRNP
jgi:putative photosynthetic complex assembly protein